MGEPNICPWEQMYNNCGMHLVPVGISHGLFDTMEVDKHGHLVQQTIITLGLLLEFRTRRPLVRCDVMTKALYHVQRWKHCGDMIKYEAATLASKSDPSDDVPCVLHLHKRIIEKGTTLIFIASVNKSSGSSTRVRLKRAEEIADIINTVSFGTPDKHGW
jgi:hypothetical protein